MSQKDETVAEHPDPDVQAAERAVENVPHAWSVPPPYLAFRLDVLRLSRTPTASADPRPLRGAATDEEIENKLRAGESLLTPSEPVLDEAFANRMAKIARLMKEAGVPGSGSFLDALEAKNTPPDLPALAAALRARDADTPQAAAEKLGLSPSLLRFAVTHALHPLLAPARKALADRIRQALWMRGWCPVCGLEPDAARLLAEPKGARVLHCPACGMEWRYKRISCPFCGNDEHARMKILFTDPHAPRRVSACLECRRYVKEVDERALAEGTEVNLVAEEITTLHLDLGAEEEGFSN